MKNKKLVFPASYLGFCFITNPAKEEVTAATDKAKAKANTAATIGKKVNANMSAGTFYC